MVGRRMNTKYSERVDEKMDEKMQEQPVETIRRDIWQSRKFGNFPSLSIDEVHTNCSHGVQFALLANWSGSNLFESMIDSWSHTTLSTHLHTTDVRATGLESFRCFVSGIILGIRIIVDSFHWLGTQLESRRNWKCLARTPSKLSGTFLENTITVLARI